MYYCLGQTAYGVQFNKITPGPFHGHLTQINVITVSIDTLWYGIIAFVGHFLQCTYILFTKKSMILSRKYYLK